MKIALLLLGFFLLPKISHAQIDSIPIQYINRTGINYRTFVESNDKVFALNDSGNLMIWDLKNLDTLHFSSTKDGLRYTAIAQNNRHEVFVSSNGNIYKMNMSMLSDTIFYSDEYPVLDICFNAANKLYMVVPYVVYDPITKKHWEKFKGHAGGISYKKETYFGIYKRMYAFFTLPQNTYLDNRDRWWMWSNYGEFGTDLEIFDAKHAKIIENNFLGSFMGLLVPQSFFNDDKGNTFITSGLQHFGNFGEIYKIDSRDSVTKIFDSQKYDTAKSGQVFADGLFIGPGAYNKGDGYIYISSSKGFFKTKLSPSGQLDKLTPVFAPTLAWSREPLAIGAKMTIKQMAFTDSGKLIFLTENDGIGIYDGKKIVMLK